MIVAIAIFAVAFQVVALWAAFMCGALVNAGDEQAFVPGSLCVAAQLFAIAFWVAAGAQL